jgi:hypothetical protein
MLMLISSCTWFYQPAGLNLDVPDGPPEYKAGWYDGCRSGLSEKKHFANAFVYDRTFGSGIYQHDPVYQSAWSYGFLSCNTGAGLFVNRNWFAGAPAE